MWFSIVIIGLRPGTRVAEQELRSRTGVTTKSEKAPPTEEQQRADDDERRGVLLLVRVQAGRDEGPHLPQDAGRGDEDAGDEPHLHLHPEGLGRRREHQLVAELGDRPGQPVDHDTG